MTTKKHWYDFLFRNVDAELGGGRKLRAPLLGLIILVVLILGGAVILFSDWSCGSLYHRALPLPFGGDRHDNRR